MNMLDTLDHSNVLLADGTYEIGPLRIARRALGNASSRYVYRKSGPVYSTLLLRDLV